MSKTSRIAPVFVCILLAACASSPEPAATQSSMSAEATAAYRSRMEWDLRNLLTAQEIHYSQHYRYAGPADDVNTLTALRYVTSQGVSLRVTEASERGWAGVSSTAELPGRGCAIFVGNAAAPATPGGTTPSTAGVVTCD